VSAEVYVVRTGAANTASVLAAFARVGARAELGVDPAAVAAASRVVLPGVGAFGPVAGRLLELGLARPLRERVEAGRPTLAICLGLQLLAAASEESPGARGLGVVAARVGRFPPGLVVPHLGWAQVLPERGCRFLLPGAAYFAHSYRLDAVPEGWTAAWSEHGGRFVAALERGEVLACQFHPELSGAWGEEVVARWVTGTGSGTGSGGYRRVIPCLDVAGGRVVKGVRFQGLRDAGDPVERAARYAEEGADELVLLDVAATPAGRGHALEVVREVRRVLPLPLTVGGGVRSAEDAGALLEAGADKVAVNTAAVERPGILSELAERFGSQCTVLALDAAANGSGFEVVVRSGRERTGRDAVAWAREAAALGAGEVLLTSWDRDGTGAGYDLELIRAVRGAVGVPVVASGGAASPAHLAEAVAAGADAVLVASIVHDGVMSVAELKARLAELGVEVRR